MLSGEPTNTNFIVFGLTRPGFEPTIYRTRGEHANHYATDAVNVQAKEDTWINNDNNKHYTENLRSSNTNRLKTEDELSLLRKCY